MRCIGSKVGEQIKIGGNKELGTKKGNGMQQVKTMLDQLKPEKILALLVVLTMFLKQI